MRSSLLRRNPCLSTMAFVIVFVVSLFSVAGADRVSEATNKPWNLVIYLTDDQGHWTLGAYGNRYCETPRTDQLAREGALFTRAFSVSPLCSPSRASFLTGLYPTQAGISDVLYWTFMETMLPPDVYQEEIRRGLEEAAITWPELLQEEGYATALIGKWHLGVQPEHHPNRHGFDYYFGPYRAGVFDLRNPVLQENGERQEYQRFMTDVFADKAIAFIERHRDRPFAMVVAPQVPHAPWNHVPDEDLAPLLANEPPIPEEAVGPGDERLRGFMRNYLGLVRTADRNLGRILDCLRDQGLADRTAVIFTSDHGFMMGHRNLLGKGTATFFAGGRFGPRRMNMFDLSLQVPLIVKWPSVAQPGSRIDDLVSSLDLFPTLFSMLGIDVPDSVRPEGADLTPLLRGDESVPWRRELFAQLDVERNGFALMRSLRSERWKLVRHHLPLMMDELYDLENDPEERRNLYRNPEFRTIRDELDEKLRARQVSIDDPVFRVVRAVHRK